MKKIYIAGPMRGHPCYNFEEFFVMANRLKKAGYEVINPAEVDTNRMFDGWQYTEDKYAEVLAHDIQILSTECFAIMLLNGWSKSPGARVEATYAKAIGLAIINQSMLDGHMTVFPFSSEGDYIRGLVQDSINMSKRKKK